MLAQVVWIATRCPCCDEIVRVTRLQVKALRLLHQDCKLVHMDVKPDNICLARPPVSRNGDKSKVPAGASLIDFTTTVPHSRADGSIPTVDEVGSHAFTSLRFFHNASETETDLASMLVAQ